MWDEWVHLITLPTPPGVSGTSFCVRPGLRREWVNLMRKMKINRIQNKKSSTHMHKTFYFHFPVYYLPTWALARRTVRALRHNQMCRPSFRDAWGSYVDNEIKILNVQWQTLLVVHTFARVVLFVSGICITKTKVRGKRSLAILSDSSFSSSKKKVFINFPHHAVNAHKLLLIMYRIWTFTWTRVFRNC